jgi:hypothetical protein
VAVSITRAQVLAHRVAAQNLDRPAADPAVLDLGLQDTPYGSAVQALAARTASPPDGLALVWATRGGPHLHRAADLPALAAALWPLSDADATARIATTPIKEGARLGIAAFEAAASAFRSVVRSPMKRGDVSTGVSRLVPESLTYWCRTCGSRHISGSLFQQAGLAGGVRLAVRGAQTTLEPIPDRPGVPTAAAGTDALIAAYLRLLGPATLADAAKYLGTTQTAVRPAWPTDLAEVRVEGRSAWIPADALDALLAASAVPVVRLLPPSDPYLQARDRDVLVPDPARQKVVWPAMGRPGTVLIDGEIAGTWRARMAARSVLEITVSSFGDRLPDLSEAAATVANLRRARDFRLLEA